MVTGARRPAASLEDVTRLLAAGATVPGAAARLGLPVGLVATMVEELERLGVVRTEHTGLPPDGCTSCGPRPVCRGCPVARAGDGGVRRRH